MYSIENITTVLAYVLSLLTFSPVERPGTEEQTPLLGFDDGLLAPDDPLPAFNNALNQDKTFDQPSAIEPTLADGPVFKPPTASLGSDFKCNYSQMSGFHYCSNSSNRECWLDNYNGTRYDIHTDYENIIKTPIGIHRYYTLNITDSWVNADGMNFTYAKLFNNTYPGPLIQACWGDVRMMAATFT